MLETHPDELRAVLSRLGIQPGDGLLIHSALQFLGRPAGGTGMYLDVLQALLGGGGTLAVPAFNFGFARGEPYDPEQTPSQGMGVFSEWVRQQPGAQRTRHPLQSLAVLGRHARYLVQRDTPGAFDPGSAFEGLLELDFSLLLLGADIQAASMVHYAEQRVGVPYRYWKDFSGEVKTPAGWEQKTCRMYVRDMDLDPQLKLAPIQQELVRRNQWQQAALGYGWVARCTLVNFVQAAEDLLRQDAWSLVSNRPERGGTHV